ncbi:MAG: uracil-DNA glycosylase family protein [Acidimicrobiales bacterium]
MAHPEAGAREKGAREELARLRDDALGCTRCGLADGRTQVVFGVGSPSADLMFVGEGPGRDEDLQGEPFVGRSGKLLDLLMRQEIGVERDECYIANVVKCLAADALVQLGDGSWERIGELVRRRYGGTVSCVDARGRIVERRVVGWHESPLGGRSVFRLTYRGAERTGAARATVDATGDHEVLTEQGWTPVDRLAPGARIATGQGPAATVERGHDTFDPSSTRKLARASDRLAVTQYDEAVVEELPPAGADTTVYCIDVEDTHNFVTAGGVVHNCRPPGNRDPLPAEIDACRPYLERQIELVSPKVVVTLGNFATKTLLETTEGIRRVRGRVYPFRGMHLVPTYHPAAALRGGGEVVAEMRADFVRAKSVLSASR